MRASEEKVDQVLHAITQGINQIVNISTFFESSITVDTPLSPADKTQHIDLIDSLLYASCRLLTQSQNITAMFSEIPNDSNIRIGELLDIVAKECKESMELVGRKLVYGKAEGNALVRMSERRFTLIMMNLMQNALLYSPAQSTISVDLTYEQNFAVIEVANFVEPQKQVISRYSERAGLGLMVVRGSAEQAHGSFSAVKKDEFFVARLRLPINHEPGVYALSSRFREYTSERFKPVHLFMNEILRKESGGK
jgi:K+-sensing histidine kinase KdpD